MKRHFMSMTAAVLSAALLLTSCDKKYGMDYSKEYNDYLTHSLGADYQLRLDRSEYDSNYKFHTSYWNASYHDSTGALREFGLETYDYKETGSDADYSTEQLFHDCRLLTVLYDEACLSAENEIKEQLLPEIMDCENPMLPEEGVTVRCFHLPLLFYSDAIYPVVQKALTPQSGLQVCTADMQSIAQDPNVLTVIAISLSEKESEGITPDPEYYAEKMQQIYEAYLRENENPQNYYFVVNRVCKSEDNAILSEECVYEKAALTGIGEFDAQARYADVTDVSTYLAMRNEMIDIREQQAQNGNP